MRTRPIHAALAALSLLAITAGCSSNKEPTSNGILPTPVTTIPGHESLPQDTAPKESPRMVPPEAYLRTYLNLFGGLAPLPLEKELNKPADLFDAWKDYLNILGLPDYGADIPRGTQSNALMLATFERIGVALCDRALVHDQQGTMPADQRLIFTFDLPAEPLDQAGFAERFDVLHRTFLGYPADLAPTERTARFFKLYSDTVTAHAAMGAPKSLFTPVQAGWSVICYGLIRHPEFHLY